MSIVLSLAIWNTSVRGMKHVNMSGGLTGYYCKVSFVIWTMEMSGKYVSLVSQVAQTIKNMPEMQETWAWSLGLRSSGGEHGNPLQYSCLENPHGERSLVGYRSVSQRVGHDWATNTFTTFTSNFQIYTEWLRAMLHFVEGKITLTIIWKFSLR